MLKTLVEELRSYPGLTRKKNIGVILNTLKDVYDFGSTLYPPGDDAAVIRYGGEYLLLAAEEISRELLCSDPWWAGFCAVLTNVNDIYAMGGTPLALVNTASFADVQQGEAVFAGVRQACLKYRVPMVGGHYSPESDHPTISAAIVGRARRVITSFDAQPGDSLLIAVDLEGKRYKSFYNWNCITEKSPETVLQRLGCLPRIAEAGLAHAAKDISNAGIVGTIGMLLETSKKGAVVSLDAIPRPSELDLISWLKMYPSYGFIFAAAQEHKHGLLQLLLEGGFTAADIGTVSDEATLVVRCHEASAVVFDFKKDAIMR